MTWLFALPSFLIAVVAAWNGRATRNNRNYAPMPRVIWLVIAAVYGGSGVAALFNAPTRPEVRAVFSALMLGAVGYAAVFIRRRNATPRYLPLALDGHVEMVAQPDLWREYERAISLTHHGDAPHAWVAGMEAAIAHWHEEQRRPQTLGERMKAQALARKRGD